jgi:hypothetical protein
MAARGQPLLLKSGCCGPPLHRFRPAALLFLTLGAPVFLATLAAILVGNRRAGGET